MPSTKKVKTAKKAKSLIKAAKSNRVIDTSPMWKSLRYDKANWDGLQVWVPVDPYTSEQRKEFRAAMMNPYVWRANRIIAQLVAGQGFTTDVFPRKDMGDINKEQNDEWKQTEKFMVPYLDKEMTPEEIRKFVFKLTEDIDLAENTFNGYFSSREQGRNVLAITPIDKDEQGKWQLPDSIRFIRPEFTLRPYLDMDTGELIGTQIVGLKSTEFNILPAERIIYILNNFNQELFADYYGDSQVARVVDPANTLNIIFSQDFLQAAEHTWHQPKVFGVPIQPQDFGREETILDEFLQRNSDAKGQDIAVVMNPDGKGGVTLLSQGTNSGDLGGLERIVVRCIKAILAYYNLPAFMLSEGEKGQLGGNANEEEIDMFINTEIVPERIKLQNILNNQFYDRVLCVLFDIEDPEKLPIKIKHTYNKPKIATIFRPELYEIGKDMVAEGLMDKRGLIDMIGFDEFATEDSTRTAGEDDNPDMNTAWTQKIWKRNQYEDRMKMWDEGGLKLLWTMPKGWNPPKPYSNQHGQWPQQEVQWPKEKKWSKTAI